MSKITLSKGQKIVQISGTKENDEDMDNVINLTRTKEGAIFFTKNGYAEDFIYFYKDQIPELIKTLKQLTKRDDGSKA